MKNIQLLFQQLEILGAGDFAHLNGSLEQHLLGTAQILDSWNASKDLYIAGLFHAAYGTAGFEKNMVTLEQRHKIAELIGKYPERLVYLYCCCDRAKFYPKIGTDQQYLLPNRFSNQTIELNQSELSHFFEMTVANELEIAQSSPEFRAKYGRDLLEIFERMGEHLSLAAQKHIQKVLK